METVLKQRRQGLETRFPKWDEHRAFLSNIKIQSSRVLTGSREIVDPCPARSVLKSFTTIFGIGFQTLLWAGTILTFLRFLSAIWLVTGLFTEINVLTAAGSHKASNSSVARRLNATPMSCPNITAVGRAARSVVPQCSILRCSGHIQPCSVLWWSTYQRDYISPISVIF